MNRSRRHLLGAAGACALLRRVRAAEPVLPVGGGLLRLAVYRDFAPFSADGRGIDVEIGQALAGALGLQARFLPFDAGEKADDDLRNMVWRGTLLGYGPADVMLHVPVDPVFAQRNPQTKIFGAYFRETLQLARNVSRVARADTLAALRGLPLGAEDGTLASVVLLSAEGGALSSGVQHYRSTAQALVDLKAGRLAAVMGLRSELQYGMAGEAGFELSDPVAPGIPPAGWQLGLAVKADREALAGALQAALDRMVASGQVADIFKQFNVSWTRP